MTSLMPEQGRQQESRQEQSILVSPLFCDYLRVLSQKVAYELQVFEPSLSGLRSHLLSYMQ